MRAAQTNSFGAAFNNNGGGVYASKHTLSYSGPYRAHDAREVQWDDSGITVYFFPRNKIPSDITANAPLPDNWGTPLAFWPAASCSPFTFFNDHSAIFDTTLWCVLLFLAHWPRVDKHAFALRSGDWAGGVWSGTGVPGQDQSCATLTGSSTCEDWVRNNGANFTEACEYRIAAFIWKRPTEPFPGTDWEVKSVQIYQTS